ncbi:MAG: LysM peptidoglycan-binding domain-containing protein [Clostridia bacterium]|nr:LysM peptidoglycan-binding domain-containing protein [Clostridia bacterium]MBQ9514301.1 LysM peptidoglycan-binding domain-containing protein [Clostridia bacterium]
MKKFFYRVVDGDTALSVCKRFSVSFSSLKKNNNLTEEIKAGDILYIEEENVYQVLPNEDFNDVAKKFGIEKEEIINKNGIDSVFYGLNLLI